ncbi:MULTISPECIES: DUF2147 domain-containing protein [Acinetobacter]|jgi:uncharacterized protein (DUF2147 family)|uniref:DUF2147 domain-containing protein n=1 Tax=Acinetobacter TaxID=469 RepID=UPI00103CD53C|nr:DUF2147 domain-containing protein [Acinetobacter sp. ANC 3781]TCB74422.1 DUF2147 domain-containing protein [Acinetobacter sp. ANC 3781]
MKKIAINTAFFIALLGSFPVFAQEITGTWIQIDDKTGSPKALIDIQKQPNGSYSGKIIKITPRPGYTPRETCFHCPPPYTDQPILGLEVFKGLQHANGNNYENGRILDPLTGKTYGLKGRVSANGKRFILRGYIGISALGRTQTWIKSD